MTTIANRHPLTGQPCCPDHGPLTSSSVGSPTPVALKGSWFVIYGFDAGPPEASDALDANGYAFTYHCAVGKHPVTVYRATGMAPARGRVYMLTPGRRANYYHATELPVTTHVTHYPVVVALLRRLWGIEEKSAKRRQQRQQRKAQVETARTAAKRQRRTSGTP